MTPPWLPLEYLPKSARYREWPDRKVALGCYIPDREPRPIPDGAHVHESVLKRMHAYPDYKPVNLPANYQLVPLPLPPVADAPSEMM